MKYFYIVSALLVVALVLLPYELSCVDLFKTDSFSQLKGQVVAYSTYGSKIRSLDPATAGDTSSATLQGNVYESLYGYHYLKRPIEVIPQLADAMPEVSVDGLTYTVKIKKGVNYARNACFGTEPDGKGGQRGKLRELKAADFVLAFKRIADYHITTPMSFAFIEDKLAGVNEFRDRTQAYDKGDFSRYSLDFKGVRAIDDYTLQFKLVAPFPQLIYVLAINNYAPIPRELIDYYLATRPGTGGGREPIPMMDRTPEITDFHQMVGTGAYVVTQFVDGGTIVLERNPDYRPEFYPSDGAPGDEAAGLLKDAGKRLPLIDASVMTYVQDDNPAWMLFVTKQVDMSGIPQAMYTQVISPSKVVTDDWARKGIRLITYTDPAVYWFAFNRDDPVLGKSKSLRQALNLGFNIDRYIENIFNGRSIRALTYMPSSFEGYKEAGAGPYAHYDLEAAKAKLAEARKELEAAGVIGPGDSLPTLKLDMGGVSELSRREGEFAMQQFKKIGLTLKIELNDWPTLQRKVENKQTQIYSMGWHADYPDPENFLQLYYTPNIVRGTNNTNYSKPEFDALYAKASVMKPSPERTALYVQALKILNEDCPALLLTEPISFVLAHSWVGNVKQHPMGYGMFKYRSLDEEARRKAGGR